MYFSFTGQNARIPIPLRRELLQKWLRQEQEGLELMQRYGDSTAGHEHRINQLRAQLAALAVTA